MPIVNGKIRLIKEEKDPLTGDPLSTTFTKTYKCFLEENEVYIANKYAKTEQITETPKIKAEVLVYKLTSIKDIQDYIVMFIPKGHEVYKRFKIVNSYPVSYLLKATTIALTERI